VISQGETESSILRMNFPANSDNLPSILNDRADGVGVVTSTIYAFIHRSLFKKKKTKNLKLDFKHKI
jgi:hypothetical protein